MIHNEAGGRFFDSKDDDVPSKAEKELEKQILKINFRLNVNERVGLRLRRAVDLDNGRSVEP